VISSMAGKAALSNVRNS